ncbi:ABC transporter substrate-binding protein [Candidatus Dojkabacteria bacterium]|jgi:peptide/nickel transport system substrate-binding protein|nr:ABC transporter substrate-binding protein [Candidatus Dojkabacteria bacterium]
MSFRDFLWDYPENIKKLYFNVAPLSFVIVFSTIFVLFFVNFVNPKLSDFFQRREKDTYVEGIVGTSETLNPLYLTNNQVDRDIQSLLFTKFIEISSDGKPVAAIAKSWSLANDNLTYSFELNSGYVWSDGAPVTADDVVFTFNYAVKLATDFSLDTFGQGMKNMKVEKVGDDVVKFILTQSSATFYESVSKYILPKHILENTTPGAYILTRFDQYPVGSGYYKVSSFSASEIDLVANPYLAKKPEITNFKFMIFPNYKDLELEFRTGNLDGIGSSKYSDIKYVTEYGNMYKSYSYQLPLRKKMIFFNLRKSELANSALRIGVTRLLDKQRLIIESGVDATMSTSPIPKTSWAYIANLPYISYSSKDAATELGLVGYKKNEQTGFFTSTDGKILSFTLAYLQNDNNDVLVNKIKEMYEKEGIIITLAPNTYEQITKETLASRDFDLILYEVEVSIDPDQYNLWHSLKSDYPGLNISGYKFTRIDAYLERGRQQQKQAERFETYKNFQKALINDCPAIFLYEPKYFYITLSKLSGFDGTDVLFPQDRFKNIADWSIE